MLTNDPIPFPAATATLIMALLHNSAASLECLTNDQIPSLTTTATLPMALLTLLPPLNALQLIQLPLLRLLLLYFWPY